MTWSLVYRARPQFDHYKGQRERGAIVTALHDMSIFSESFGPTSVRQRVARSLVSLEYECQELSWIPVNSNNWHRDPP